MTNTKQTDTDKVNSFVNEVILQLTFEEDDRDDVIKDIVSLKKEGFSIKDAVSYCQCLDECGCLLEEKLALAKMSRIRSKYR
jgi:hypothetical protein